MGTRKLNIRRITEIPKSKGKGIKTDYSSMVGKYIEYLVEDNYIVKIKVLEYLPENNSKYKIEFDGEERLVTCSNILKGNITNIIKKKGRDYFYYKEGEVIKDNKREIIILESFVDKKDYNDGINRSTKRYKVKCLKCNNVYETCEKVIRHKRGGCPYCCNNGKRAMLGLNTIWDTDRWMCDLGLSEQDAKTHTKWSNDIVKVICPDCGKEKNIRIYDIIKNSDGISCICKTKSIKYPERFMSCVLNQLGVEYAFQITKKDFSWCDKYKYDFYIPSIDGIIETHGGQHYKENTNFSMTLKEIQENDEVKYKLALYNGIKDENYIVIDCRYSDREYIKNSILNSKLNELFDLSKIDWLKCEKETIKFNLTKKICDRWNNKEEWETVRDVINNNDFGVKSNATIIKHLKIGTELGLCNYSAKEERLKNVYKTIKVREENRYGKIK